MNKRVVVSIVVIILVIICSYNFIIKKNDQIIATNENCIYLGNYYDNTLNNKDYVFTNYNDYHEKIKSDVLKKSDFDKNNYVLISMSYNPCSVSDLKPTSYTIVNNNIDVNVKYKANCGYCAQSYVHYLLKVDKQITSAKVNINYQAINKPHCDPDISDKPLIYLYPEEKMDVTVRLGYPEKLTTTYPKYNNGWKVTAYPNGDLKHNNNTYYALYWEGYNNLNPTFEDGFIVKGSETASFLEEKLTILGLNNKEKNEFIIYWLPRLENNKYNLIRFETLENINKEMPLEINPKPNTIIRVLMEYKPLDKKIEIKEQKLSTPKREGFTVVEWGGSEIK